MTSNAAALGRSTGQADLAMSEATIFALASGAGRAGVAVIRLSGAACRSILRKLSGEDVPAARNAVLRRFFDPESGEIIDEGLVIWFPNPKSFTGEDVLEFHVHGGPAVLSGLFDTLSALEGVRPAEPGEFSRRAFLNGKVNLTQAEGMADLVAAETRQQARQARRQMDGELGRLYQGWHERLVKALAYLEAEIDFAPDEEVPDGLMLKIGPDLQQLCSEIDRHLADGNRGERLRNGLQVALIGPTNAGKSSLINVLSNRDVAIVTDIPGTTRDILSVPLDLNGYPLTVVDMAGLRATDDPIEVIGVERARERAREADVLLALFDGATWPDLDRETRTLVDHRTLVLLNKIDLLKDQGRVMIEEQDAIGISCHTGEGIEQLVEALTSVARQNMAIGDEPMLTRARYRGALADVAASITRMNEAETPELALIAEDLRIAMGAMGRITGHVGVEDLLDRIFGDFCIGK